MRTSRRKPKKLTASQAKKRGLVTGKDVVNNAFAGLYSNRRQPFGRTIANRGRRGR